MITLHMHDNVINVSLGANYVGTGLILHEIHDNVITAP